MNYRSMFRPPVGSKRYGAAQYYPMGAEIDYRRNSPIGWELDGGQFGAAHGAPGVPQGPAPSRPVAAAPQGPAMGRPGAGTPGALASRRPGAPSSPTGRPGAPMGRPGAPMGRPGAPMGRPSHPSDRGFDHRFNNRAADHRFDRGYDHRFDQPWGGNNWDQNWAPPPFYPSYPPPALFAPVYDDSSSYDDGYYDDDGQDDDFGAETLAERAKAELERVEGFAKTHKSVLGAGTLGAAGAYYGGPVGGLIGAGAGWMLGKLV